jgi:hypothetical protein
MRCLPLRWFFAVCAILAIIPYISGCGTVRRWWRRPDPASFAPLHVTPQARDAVAAVRTRNQGLESIKGLGRVRVVADGRRQSLRVAWMVRLPDCLRIEVLGPYGRPVASLATDGRDLYLRDYGDGRFYRKSLSPGDSLRELIPLDLHPGELIALLTGRIAVQSFDGAELTAEDHDGAWVILSRSGRGVVQRIHLDGTRRFASRVEVLEADGSIRYAADLKAEMAAGEFRVPEELILRGGDGALVTLNVEQVWENPVVDRARFVLEEPGDERRDRDGNQRDAGR